MFGDPDRRAARRDDRSARHSARVQATADLRLRRQATRSRWALTLRGVGRWARPVAPLLVVTGFAMLGQILYGVEAYAPDGWPLGWRVGLAIGAAAGVESIALYVAWHAHDALLMGATATAARMRRASYGIALAVAAVNYSHFADGWSPTPAAVVFALFSASGPWLWGLHTRRAKRVQLLREGQADSSGAVFSAERWRAFPVRTWAARRWSIDHGVIDPREAWAGYNLDRATRQQEARERSRELSPPRQPCIWNFWRRPTWTATDNVQPTTRRVADLVAEQPATLPATPGEIDAGDPATVPMAIPPAPATEDVAPPATRPALHLALAVADDATTPPAGVDVAGDGEGGEDEVAKAQWLLAKGAGRSTLARQLDLKPHQARALLERPDEVATLLPRWRARQATHA